MSELILPEYSDIAAAAERIDGYANKTPVMTSRTINEEFGAEVFSNVKTSRGWAHSNSEEL